MKKLLFILLIFPFITTHAQLEKGTKLIGLQTNILAHDMYTTHFALSFGSSGHDLGLSIIPTFGYALQRNWLVGAQATFGIESVKYGGFGVGYDHIDTHTDLGIAPFTRLYLDLTKNKKWKLFGVAAFEFVTTSTKSHFTGGSYPADIYYYNTTGLGSIGGGLADFGKKLNVDLSMSTTALRLGFYRVLPGKKK